MLEKLNDPAVIDFMVAIGCFASVFFVYWITKNVYGHIKNLSFSYVAAFLMILVGMSGIGYGIGELCKEEKFTKRDFARFYDHPVNQYIIDNMKLEDINYHFAVISIFAGVTFTAGGITWTVKKLVNDK